MAQNTNPVYAFDPNGINQNNIIRNERHTVTIKNNYDFNYIVPDYAPFFVNDFKMYTLTQQGAKNYMVEGVDYVFGFRFIQATMRAGKVLYGSVQFINRKFSGDVYLEYRTVGGIWNIDAQKINHILSEWMHNPVTTSWEQVADLPQQFPVIEHTHDINKMPGIEELIAEVRKLGSASRESLQESIINQVNLAVGRITKNDIGLGNIRNLSTLPATKYTDRSEDYYVTPKSVVGIIDNYIKPMIVEHINARGNVHHLTAADIGAITTLDLNNALSGKLGKNEKAADTTLMDGRNSQQLKNWVLEGTSGNTIKFNNLTYPQMMEDVTNRINSSIQSATGSNNEAIMNRLNSTTVGNTQRFGNKTPDEYATWLLAKEINATTLNGKNLTTILSEAKNNVNAAQLNGSTKEQIIASAKQNVNAARLEGKSVSDLKFEFQRDIVANNVSPVVVDRITQTVRTNIAGNLDAATLGGKSAAAIINEAKNNVTQVGGLTVDQIVAKSLQQANNSVNSGSFGGKTPQAWREEIRQSHVSDSDQLAGKSLATIKTEIENENRNAFTKNFVNMGTGVDQLAPTANANILKMGWSNKKQVMTTVDSKNLGYLYRFVKVLTSEDLNTLKGDEHYGFYSQDANVNATAARNYPEQRAGTLWVMPGAYQGLQFYTVFNTGNTYFRTTEYDGSWGNWMLTSVSENRISHSTTGTDTTKVASEKAVGDLKRATDTNLDTKVGKEGNQAINGQLQVGKQNEWTKILMPSGNGNWIFETLPSSNVTAASKVYPRLNLKYTEGNNVYAVRFPEVTKDETVVYKSYLDTAAAQAINQAVTKVYNEGGVFKKKITLTPNNSEDLDILGSASRNSGFKFKEDGSILTKVASKDRVIIEPDGSMTIYTGTGARVLIDNNGNVKSFSAENRMVFNSGDMENTIINTVKAFLLDSNSNKLKTEFVPPARWS